MMAKKVKNSSKAKKLYKKTLSKKRRKEVKKINIDILTSRKSNNNFVSSYDMN
jgi:hypothetical protein